MPVSGSSDEPALTSARIGDGDTKMGIDEMLERHAGEFGPWQLRHFVLTRSAFHTMVVVFANREPDWRCTDRTSTACLPQPPRTMCGLDPGSWEWTDGPGSSTVAAWGLVCGSQYKIGLAQSGYFVGNMSGPAFRYNDFI